jgi:hypothetical protein
MLTPPLARLRFKLCRLLPALASYEMRFVQSSFLLTWNVLRLTVNLSRSRYASRVTLWRHRHVPRNHGHTADATIYNSYMYAVMDTKRVTNNEATTIKTRQGNNNEETLKQRQQAAERKRLNRARKRQQHFNITTIHNQTPHTTRSSRHFVPPSFLVYDQKHWRLN